MVTRQATSNSRKPSKRPWLHGPVPWEVAQRAGRILATLVHSPKRFLSLRQTARLLGISTQPVRDWLQAGLLEASGPRKQIPARAVEGVVRYFMKSARPYEMESRPARLLKHRTRPPRPFEKLFSADFKWPSKRAALRTGELAALAECHRSLVLKAIHAGKVVGRRVNPRRWEITRRKWNQACLLRGLQGKRLNLRKNDLTGFSS